jgi:hypothetical protein
MKKQQMELGFDSSVFRQPAMRGQRRLGRAHWWFSQMRQVIERAASGDLPSPKRRVENQSSLDRQIARSLKRPDRLDLHQALVPMIHQ